MQSSRISSWRIQLSLVCVCDPAYGALRAIALSIRPFALSRFGDDRISSIQLPATDRASWGSSCVRACSLTARSTWLVFKPLINHLRACESGESPGIIIIVHRNGGSSGCRYPRSVCICLRLRCLDNSLAQLCARGRSPPLRVRISYGTPVSTTLA